MFSNAIRGHMAELGIISAKGRNGTAELLQITGNVADDRIPPVARFCLDVLARHYLTLTALLARRPTKVAEIALANKIARMAWAVMARGERYREPVALTA